MVCRYIRFKEDENQNRAVFCVAKKPFCPKDRLKGMMSEKCWRIKENEGEETLSKP